MNYEQSLNDVHFGAMIDFDREQNEYDVEKARKEFIRRVNKKRHNNRKATNKRPYRTTIVGGRYIF